MQSFNQIINTFLYQMNCLPELQESYSNCSFQVAEIPLAQITFIPIQNNYTAYPKTAMVLTVHLTNINYNPIWHYSFSPVDVSEYRLQIIVRVTFPLRENKQLSHSSRKAFTYRNIALNWSNPALFFSCHAQTWRFCETSGLAYLYFIVFFSSCNPFSYGMLSLSD